MCSFVDILYMLLGLYAELLTLLFLTLTHFSLQSGVFVKFLYFVLLKFHAFFCCKFLIYKIFLPRYLKMHGG
jgi:hypothetical protein